MPGPTPKPANTRQRRNKTTTAAQFETTEPARREAPELGEHPHGEECEWHPRTHDFWREVWESPMADEYLRADTDGLLALATLVDQFWRDPSTKLAQEIRLQRQCFGLTPIDRRRLQWEIVRAEAAERRKPKPKTSEPTTDPRQGLKAI